MCMLGVGDLCLGPSGDLGLISTFTCQGSKWQSLGDSVLIMMEPSQPLTGWLGDPGQALSEPQLPHR